MTSIEAGRSMRAILCGFLAAAGVYTLTENTDANPYRATTSPAAKNEAVQSIPFDKLNPGARAKVAGVVSKPSIYRRMPVKVINCDPDLYVFLMRYPEVIVNIWELMGITQIDIKRIAPYTFDASDGAGTVGRVELVYGDHATHIFFADSYYQGPLVSNRLTGRCVLLLKSGYRQTADGQVQITNRLDTFIQIDNVGAELIAKTLHPLIGRTADYNFTESAQFLSRVSQAAERNGPGVQRLAAKLTSIDPAVRDRFAQLAAGVSHKAALRAAGGPSNVVFTHTPVGTHTGSPPSAVSPQAPLFRR